MWGSGATAFALLSPSSESAWGDLLMGFRHLGSLGKGLRAHGSGPASQTC